MGHHPGLAPDLVRHRHVAWRSHASPVLRGIAEGLISGGNEWCLMDVDDETRTIGQRLRRIRKARDKSLQVVAELAGMNRMTLQRIERAGDRAE
ncbi:MAG: helix-turn-helix domain-containing protein [Pseudonocardiaceae bacterium]